MTVAVIFWAVAALNLACALWSLHEARRARALVAESAARSVGLQHAVDRAWDAMHEFEEDPQIAMSAACEYLEQVVTSLADEARL